MIHAVGDHDVAHLHREGARAVERDEFCVGGQAQSLGGARDDRHHIAFAAAAFGIVHLEDGAEIMVVAEIGDVGQQALDDIATVAAASFQPHRLDAEQALHRVGQRGAAQRLAVRNLRTDALLQCVVVGGVDVPSERVLAPHAERGRQAILAGRRHGIDRRDQIDGVAMSRKVMRVRAEPTEFAHRCFRDNNLRRQFFARATEVHARPRPGRRRPRRRPTLPPARFSAMYPYPA